MIVTQQMVDSLNRLIDKGLNNGGTESGPMDVCQAISLATGGGLFEVPSCVNAEVMAFSISLNDTNWGSISLRAEGMRRLAIAQLGSEVLDSRDFLIRLLDLAEKEHDFQSLYLIRSYINSPKNGVLRLIADFIADLAIVKALTPVNGLAPIYFDQVLAEFAEMAVRVLIEMKSPGAAWLK